MSYTDLAIPEFNGLDFWRHLVWEMVENTLDEETVAVGVYGRRLITRRGTLGDHKIVTAPKYCGKWFVDENKWWRVKQPYQKQICNNQSGYCKKITRRYFRFTKVLLLCSGCYETHVLYADS